MSIILNGLTKKYNENAVVNNINLKLNKNEITFITGTSGAGKSTLLYLVGLLEIQTEGSIKYHETDICTIPEVKKANFRGKHIGFMFQDSNLLSGFTVTENLYFQLELSGNNIAPEKINQVLKELDILKLKDRKIETLSGGERQRVVIAGSILKDADIILADEPTGNLDKANSQMVMNLLQKIKQDRIIIVVSHDGELANLYADRIIKISDGKIIDDYYTNKTNFEVDTPILKQSSQFAGKLGLKNILRMSLGNIAKRLSSFITICIALSFALASLLIIAVLNIGLSDMTTVMNKNYLETDLVSVSKTTSGYYRFIKKPPISSTELEQFINLNDYQQITPIYNESLFLNTDTSNEQIVYRQIIFNSFYEDRIMTLDIEGNFPKDKYQFIISEEVKTKLNVNIGDIVMLNNGNDYQLNLQIVGINKTITFDKLNYCYLHNEVVRELLELNQQDPKMVFIHNVNEFESNVMTGKIKADLSTIDGMENIIAGNSPANEQEIIISSAIFSHFLQSIDDNYINISVDDLINGTVEEDILNELYSANFVIGTNDVYIVQVSGVFLSDELLIKVKADSIEKYYTVLPTQLEMFAKELSAINALENKLSNDDYLVIIHSEHLRGTIMKSTLVMQAVVLVVSFILLILSISLINTYVKLNVRERFYDIGILKSLGARKMDILKVFSCDFIIISIISTILGVVIAYLLRLLLPLISESLTVIHLNFPIWLILASFLFSFIISFFSSILPLLKATKLSPVEAIRKR